MGGEVFGSPKEEVTQMKALLDYQHRKNKSMKWNISFMTKPVIGLFGATNNFIKTDKIYFAMNNLVSNINSLQILVKKEEANTELESKEDPLIIRDQEKEASYSAKITG